MCCDKGLYFFKWFLLTTATASDISISLRESTEKYAAISQNIDECDKWHRDEDGQGKISETK